MVGPAASSYLRRRLRQLSPAAPHTLPNAPSRCAAAPCCALLRPAAEDLGAATVGLAFSNIIQMLVFYTWAVRFIAESISLFNSVEGMAYLAEYVPTDGVFFDGNAEKGAAESIIGPDGTIIPVKTKVEVVVDDARLAGWPASGNVAFDGVWMQYRLDAPWALKGVTFAIKDSEKVGVVGRTGSGKSTLLLALYRMFELGRGRVIIDGVDISTLSLRRLRQGE